MGRSIGNRDSTTPLLFEGYAIAVTIHLCVREMMDEVGGVGARGIWLHVARPSHLEREAARDLAGIRSRRQCRKRAQLCEHAGDIPRNPTRRVDL